MKLRILVPLKRVVDYNIRVKPRADGSGVDKSIIKMSLNPFCENALEEAIRLKEKGVASEVFAVSIGPEKTKDVLQTALAMGADSALLLSTAKEIDKEVQPIHVAHALKALVQARKFDTVLMGKQAIDDDFTQTPQMLAAMLNWPMALFISKLEADAAKATFKAEREVDGGLQQVELPFNSVISCDLRVNKPRLPKLPDIMKAKKKPIETIPFEEEKGLKAAKVLEIKEPAARKGGVMVESVDELIAKLKNVDKVL